MSANIDRRTFLAGTTAGSLVLLSLGGCNKPDENKGAIKTSAGSDSGQAKPHYAMVFDQNKCIGCGRCYIACYDAGHQALDFDAEARKPVFLGSKCVGCHLCATVCPVNCISKAKRVAKKH